MTRKTPARALLWLTVLLSDPSTPAAEPAANAWVKTDAAVEGRRWDVPVGYDPTSKRFLVLGGRTSWADSKNPRSYDVLSFDPAGKWHNELPAGADWGPEFGPVAAPAWKDE